MLEGEAITGLGDAMYREEAWRQLRTMSAPDPNMIVEHRMADGDAAFETLKLANTINADLTVMGTHGRGGLSRLLLGSVAEQSFAKQLAKCCAPSCLSRNPKIRM